MLRNERLWNVVHRSLTDTALATAESVTSENEEKDRFRVRSNSVVN
jgi:hypothetical protein